MQVENILSEMYNNHQSLSGLTHCIKGDYSLAIRYTLSYIDQQSGGFNFFGLFKRREKEKCVNCKFAHAVMEITDNENKDNKIKLCVLCYNENSVEDLLNQSLIHA